MTPRGARGGSRRGRSEAAALSHVSPSGEAKMVDVGAKRPTVREAQAEAWVEIGEEAAERIRVSGGLAKGSVLETARIAGIMAAKKTPELIPMCHPVSIDIVEMTATLEGARVRLAARVRATGKTGVEMEAMTAVAAAALTVYDMVKSAGKGIEITAIRLLEKKGGRSGSWKRSR